MKLFVKNMVCDRCISAVRRVLAQAGFPDADVSLGVVGLPVDSIEPAILEQIGTSLRADGFDLITDREDQLVERIRTAIIAFARSDSDTVRNLKLSAYLAERLGTDYTTLSRLFSAREQRTIESFLIAQKIEYVKELLEYGELTLSEIAWRTGYSSVAHLSRQFRAITGMTASEYRRNSSGRSTLDRV